MSWLKRLFGIDYNGLQNQFNIGFKELAEMADDIRSLGSNFNQLATLAETIDRMARNKTEEELRKNPTFEKVFKNFNETLSQIKKQLIFALSLEEAMKRNERKAGTANAKAAAGQPPPWGVEWGARAPPR
ncbi:hypothetical protein HYU12_03820 [Candidatus Woesearchaeota archaeon]|nr:hypothetical protein [Candidatus Woesearchaeota archaeon]